MLIIGHRGDRANHEDNTIESFRSAFKKGADGIELDLYYSDEEELYITHSPLHDRENNYPTLKEVLDIFADSGRIIIEIKDTNPSIIEALASLLSNYPNASIEVNSSILPILKPLSEQLQPKFDIGLIVKDHLIIDGMSITQTDKRIMDLLQLTSANSLWIVDFTYKFWTGDRISFFHDQGIQIGNHYKEGNPKQQTEAERIGIDYFLTDNLL